MAGLPDQTALQKVIDRLEIAEMQNRYMYALDWNDADVYAGLFVADGEMEWPEGRARGHSEIHDACVRIGAYFGRIAAAAAPTKASHLRHFVTNQVIDIQGDTARARAYWFDLDNDNKPRWPYVAGYGYYEDDLVRTAEGWRFTRRLIVNEMTGVSRPENPCW
ncbi:nuclear transport factor 2 family protein [Sphingomonas sp. MMS24-J13]|uniref:nuclear transport factor 2 family protein n=1 Tax=Sphingomonas sp. MMS24-J13 TaxID=3238686 RepID=UPI00384D2D8E